MSTVAIKEPRAWTSRYWWSLAALVFLLQGALIIIFGAKNPRAVLAIPASPTLQVAKSDDEFMALSDPTLFALPHTNDFSAAKRMETPAIEHPSFTWNESPRWLPLGETALLNSFGRFMQTNSFPAGALDFKPEPIFSEPIAPPTVPTQPISTLSFRGELTRRPLLHPIKLKNWPATDVIAPSKVQVVVNTAGQVISAVLLTPDYGIVPSDAEFEAETRNDLADRSALQLARSAQFMPGPQLTVGQMIFNWQAAALIATTNSPSKPR